MSNQEPCLRWRRLLLLVTVSGGLWLAAGVAGQARAGEPSATGLAELARQEAAFTAVADQAFPAVVVITNQQAVGRGRRPGGYQELPPELRRFFGMPEDDAVAGDEEDATEAPARRHGGALRPVGKGSGVLFRDTGYVVTNCHVIADADALEVKLHDGRVFDNARHPREVEVVGMDPETDLAVLRIGEGKLKGLPTLPFADSAKVKVGQFAIAVGAPFNFDYSLSVGHVSQKGRHDMNVNRYENYIQTDASINPGNSGGPLLNIRGEVIGINEFIVNGGTGGNVGLGFAIASNLVRQVAEGLAANHGKMQRPWLGIAMQPLTPELRRQFKTGVGVVVNDVVRGDPAAQGGMRPGDVIVTVGDTPVRTPHDVQFAILNYRPGDRIPMTVNRRGKELRLEVVARQKDGDGERAVAAASAAEKKPGAADPPLRRLHRVGINLEDTPDGVMVVAVRPGSLAAQAQLRRGDRILEINQRPVRSVAEVNAALVEAGDEVVLYIARRESKFFVPLAASGDTGG
jgi:Do/DeqQ family serine protease